MPLWPQPDAHPTEDWTDADVIAVARGLMHPPRMREAEALAETLPGGIHEFQTERWRAGAAAWEACAARGLIPSDWVESPARVFYRRCAGCWGFSTPCAVCRGVRLVAGNLPHAPPSQTAAAVLATHAREVATAEALVQEFAQVFQAETTRARGPVRLSPVAWWCLDGIEIDASLPPAPSPPPIGDSVLDKMAGPIALDDFPRQKLHVLQRETAQLLLDHAPRAEVPTGCLHAATSCQILLRLALARGRCPRAARILVALWGEGFGVDLRKTYEGELVPVLLAPVHCHEVGPDAPESPRRAKARNPYNFQVPWAQPAEFRRQGRDPARATP